MTHPSPPGPGVQPLRALHAGEAPYPGTLYAGEPPCVCVADAPDALWQASASGHVIAAFDTVLTDEGVGAMVPHCPVRLREHTTSGTLGPGQVVTVAVSMVRAAAEAAERGEAAGSWWVDAGGRPVLALSTGGSWREEAAQIVTDLFEGSPVFGDADGRVHELLQEALTDHTPARAETAEQLLFTLSRPAALSLSARSTQEEEGAASSPSAMVSRQPDGTGLRRPRRRGSGRGAAAYGVVAWLDSEVTDRVVGAGAKVAGGVRAVADRLRAPRTGNAVSRRRLRPWHLAVAVGAALLVAGAVWPSDAGEADVGPSAPKASSAAPEPGEVEEEEEVDEDEDEDEWTARVRALLRAAAACLDAEADACVSPREDPRAPALSGLAATPAALETARVIDEYGGVSVLRLEGAGHPAQTIVLVEAGQKWLIREVFDLADQP